MPRKLCITIDGTSISFKRGDPINVRTGVGRFASFKIKQLEGVSDFEQRVQHEVSKLQAR